MFNKSFLSNIVVNIHFPVKLARKFLEGLLPLPLPALRSSEEKDLTKVTR